METVNIFLSMLTERQRKDFERTVSRVEEINQRRQMMRVMTSMVTHRPHPPPRIAANYPLPAMGIDLPQPPNPRDLAVDLFTFKPLTPPLRERQAPSPFGILKAAAPIEEIQTAEREEAIAYNDPLFMDATQDSREGSEDPAALTTTLALESTAAAKGKRKEIVEPTRGKVQDIKKRKKLDSDADIALSELKRNRRAKHKAKTTILSQYADPWHPPAPEAAPDEGPSNRPQSIQLDLPVAPPLPDVAVAGSVLPLLKTKIFELATEPHRRVHPKGIYELEAGVISKMKHVYTFNEGSGSVVDVKVATLNGRSMAAIACCTLEGEYNRFGELSCLDMESGEVRLLDGHFIMNNANNEKVHCTVSDISFSRSGDRLFSSSFDKTIKVWSMPTGKLECSFVHEDKVNRLAVNPYNDQVLASCCKRGLVYVWNIDKDSKGMAIRDHKVGKSTADSIAFCTPDQFVATRNCMTRNEKSKESEVFVCNIEKFACLFHFEETQSYISSAIVFPQTQGMFATGSMGLGHTLVRIFETRLDKHVWKTVTDQKEIQTICISPCETFLASCGLDRSIKVYDRRFSGGPLYQLSHSKGISSKENQGVCASQFSPHGLLVTGSDDAEVRIWDLKSAHPLIKKLDNNASTLTSLAFSDDLCYLVCGMDSGASVYSNWNRETNWRLAKLQE